MSEPIIIPAPAATNKPESARETIERFRAAGVGRHASNCCCLACKPENPGV